MPSNIDSIVDAIDTFKPVLTDVVKLINSGLAYQGVVSAYTDTTHCKISILSGYGDAYFKNWYIYVLWDSAAAGAAPQSEQNPISAYTSTDGAFTHSAFTSPVSIGDKVLIFHPSIAYIYAYLTGSVALASVCTEGRLAELDAANMPADIAAITPAVSTITYSPSSAQDTGDLEGATKTITATSEATGVGNADYSSAKTLPVPSNSALAILRVATRLAVTIDSMTAGTLNYRVYVDSQVAGNLLYDSTWVTTGAKIVVQDTLVGTKETIFNLLKDGSAHTFYFFFWVNAGNAVLSLVELWEGVGATGATGWGKVVMSLTHTGLFSISPSIAKVGTGTHQLLIGKSATLVEAYENVLFLQKTTSTSQILTLETIPLLLSGAVVGIQVLSSEATDLVYVGGITFIIRTK